MGESITTTTLSDVSMIMAKHLFSKQEYKENNVVFSPLSLQVVLSMIAVGSDGPTQQQLLNFLRFKSTDHLNSFVSHLLSVTLKDATSSGGPRLSFANSVWVDQSLSVQPSFKETVSTDYEATLSSVDFQNKAIEVTKEVNLWAEKETNGLIKEILPQGSVDSLTDLIFANALYFKGAWKDPFLDLDTEDDYFHLMNGNSVKVPFMRSNRDQFISVFDDFKVLRLPYKQGQDERRQFSMYLFLPNAKDGLSALVEKVASEPELLRHKLPDEKVKVDNFVIPKFKFSFGLETSNVMKDLGVILPFTPGGLTRMVNSLEEGQNLFVSNIFHKSFIDVNEKGTEAAAASSACLTSRCWSKRKGIDFIADHPFLFLIREDLTQTILFMGQMLNPLDRRMDLQCQTSRKRRRMNSRPNTSSTDQMEKTVSVTKTMNIIRDSSTNPINISLTIANHLFSKQPNNNIVFSPLSLQVILSIIAAGSEGPTRQQLLDFLRFESINHLNSFFSQLISVILKDAAPSGGPRLSFVNGAWVEKTVSLQRSFKKIVSCDYMATLASVDFLTKALEVTKEVNLWVEKQTNGVVKEILPVGSIDNLTRLVFANALSFKGRWNANFDASMTQDYDFHLLNGKSVMVPFMTNENKQFLKAFDGYKVLRLPYKQGEDKRQFSMYIFLPNEKDGLPALIEKIASKPELLYRKLPFKKVKVGKFRIPKFKFSFVLETSHALKELGVILPFSEGGLTKMVDSPEEGQNLFVSKIFHNAFIEVNEEGTEATSSTIAYLQCEGVCIQTGQDFVADHPFLFLIEEVSTRTVLFMGQMLNPLVGSS